MTIRLFDQDPELRAFTAQVIACEDKGEGRYAVELDRTAFFPEGGGQGADHGTLGGANVLDVHDSHGTITHLTDGALPVDTLQRYLDDFLRRHPEAAIDYIHGEDVVRRLCQAPDAIGFLLPPLDKSDFFPAIQRLGVLPRKTFSMGHAHEKRFYMECKTITD